VFEMDCGSPCADEGLRSAIGRQVRVDWMAAPREHGSGPKSLVTSIARTDRSTGPRRSDVQPPDDDALLVCPRRAPDGPPDEATEWCEPTARGSFDADFVGYEIGDYVYLRVRLDTGEERSYSCGRGCDDEVMDGRRAAPRRIRVRWRVVPDVFLDAIGYTGPCALVDEVRTLIGPPPHAAPGP
jgi:hypothetical protein